MFEFLGPGWWNYLGRTRGCGLVGGGVSLGAGFEISKDLHHSQYTSFYFLFVDQDMNSQLLVRHHAFLSAPELSTVMVTDS